MITNKLQFLAQKVAPHPQEVDYWIDLTSDPYGTIIRTWNGNEWKQISELSYDDIKALQTRMTNAETNINTLNNTEVVTSVYPDPLNVDSYKFHIQKEKLNGAPTHSSAIEIKTATESWAGLMSSGDKVKINKVITDGDGASTLYNDGTYKETYTKAQVDSIKSTINQTISSLDVDKYDKTETYNKIEVDNKITQAKADILSSAPEELDTLEELAAALGDDPNFATTVMNNIGTKVTKPTSDGTKYFADDNTYKTLTKETVGLDNVDNTSDLNKPISTATQNALNNKVDKVTGKQLSTNDYTTEEKNKLASIDLTKYLDIETFNHIVAMLHDDAAYNYYGVKFPVTGPEDTILTRTGNMEWHQTLPVQSMMKTCTITSDGVVKYVKADDRTKYEDDTNVDTTLNLMVEIPEFWYKCSKDNNWVYLDIFPQEPNIPNVTHVEKFYIAAYEGYVQDGVLKSIKGEGIVPTVNTNRANFQTYARANNSSTDNWNGYTYIAHRALCVLYFVEYACSNSQAAFNASLTSEGYKQGGLGSGVTDKTTYQSNGTTVVYSYVPCGTTDSLGNSTGVVEYTASGYDNTGAAETFQVSVPSYRGIENPFGHVWKVTVDTVTHYNPDTQKNDMYCTTDRTKFGSTTLSDYKVLCSTLTSRGYKKNMTYNTSFDLFASELSGSATTYWCDHNHTGNNTIDRRLCVGGGSSNGAYAGLVYLDSGYGLATASPSVGCRLVYLP